MDEKVLFVIDDSDHCTWMGRFASRDDAVAELRRLAEIPWDQEPNRAPCTNWKRCGRSYYLLELEVTPEPPWRRRSRVFALAVSAAGVRWGDAFRAADA